MTDYDEWTYRQMTCQLYTSEFPTGTEYTGFVKVGDVWIEAYDGTGLDASVARDEVEGFVDDVIADAEDDPSDTPTTISNDLNIDQIPDPDPDPRPYDPSIRWDNTFLSCPDCRRLRADLTWTGDPPRCSKHRLSTGTAAGGGGNVVQPWNGVTFRSSK